MIVILWAHPISSLWLPKHAHTIRVFFTFSITTSVWRPEHVRSIVFFLFVIGNSMFFFHISYRHVQSSVWTPKLEHTIIIIWKDIILSGEAMNRLLNVTKFLCFKKVCRCKWGLIVKLLLLLLLSFYFYLFFYQTSHSYTCWCRVRFEPSSERHLARRKSLILTAQITRPV